MNESLKTQLEQLKEQVIKNSLLTPEEQAEAVRNMNQVVVEQE